MAFTCDFSTDFNNDFAICLTTEVLSYISPPQACVGGAAFALTVTGTGFTGAAVVTVNGSSRTTVYVSATQLIATIPASDLVNAAQLSITVVDGATTTNVNYLNVVACPVVAAGKGPLIRPQFDHLADIRPGDSPVQDMIALRNVYRVVGRQ